MSTGAVYQKPEYIGYILRAPGFVADTFFKSYEKNLAYDTYHTRACEFFGVTLFGILPNNALITLEFDVIQRAENLVFRQTRDNKKL